MDNRPIGIFDSGLGGLTVLKAMIDKMPNEHFIYLGDTARLPYGSKSPDTISKYLQQNIKFLNQYDVKAIVIACNSASSIVDDKLRQIHSTPLFEVIGPGSQKALAVTKNFRIGVIGTRATINMHAYKQKMTHLFINEKYSLEKHLEIFEHPCPLFVPLIEEGLTDDPLTNLIVYRYIQQFVDLNIDTLILGCTHYPLLKKAITKVTGPHIQLVDSASTVTQQVFLFLNEKRLLSDEPSLNPSSSIQILCTDLNSRYEDLIQQFLSTHIPLKIYPVDI